MDGNNIVKPDLKTTAEIIISSFLKLHIIFYCIFYNDCIYTDWEKIALNLGYTLY